MGAGPLERTTTVRVAANSTDIAWLGVFGPTRDCEASCRDAACPRLVSMGRPKLEARERCGDAIGSTTTERGLDLVSKVDEWFSHVLLNLTYLALIAFVAWGRFGPESFTG